MSNLSHQLKSSSVVGSDKILPAWPFAGLKDICSYSVPYRSIAVQKSLPSHFMLTLRYVVAGKQN